jgi:hypothetical protein
VLAILAVVACNSAGVAPSPDSTGSVGDDANGADALGDANGNANGDANGGSGTCELVIPQSGCLRGTACYIDIDTLVQSCLPAGSAAENAHCTQTNDCEPGTGCGVVQGFAGCHRYCDTTADCTGGPGSLCQYNISGTNDNVCTASCNPDANTGCGTGAGCRVLYGGPGGTTALTECGKAGAKTQFQLCGGDSDCAGGYACVGAFCRKICNVAANDCSNPYHCGASAPAAIINGINYGTCDP